MVENLKIVLETLKTWENMSSGMAKIFGEQNMTSSKLCSEAMSQAYKNAIKLIESTFFPN